MEILLFIILSGLIAVLLWKYFFPPMYRAYKGDVSTENKGDVSARTRWPIKKRIIAIALIFLSIAVIQYLAEQAVRWHKRAVIEELV